MTQEDKQLLLVDLCGRLPYGVKIELMPVTRGKCATLTPIILYDYYISDDVNYLPYLRPISSMTEEEDKEFALLQVNVHRADILYAIDCIKVIEWLNKHHFDFRGLISKGLAIEVTEKNNPYKE